MILFFSKLLKNRQLAVISILIVVRLVACNGDEKVQQKMASSAVRDFFNYGDSGIGAGEVQIIPIEKPVGSFRVWTKRIGNNPRIKV